MGKEKETFERWRQPKRAAKVGTRANPTADPTTSLKITRRKNVDGGGKALGMKSTTLQKDVGEVPSPGSRPEGRGMSVVHFRERMLLQPYAPKYCPCSYISPKELLHVECSPGASNASTLFSKSYPVFTNCRKKE